jgi:hypothetical protein
VRLLRGHVVGGGRSLMAACSGIKPNGERCKGIPATGSDYCPAHDPARAEARKRAASKAARSTPNHELRDLKRRISEVVDAVLDGSQDRGRAAVAIQGFNALRGALDLERRVRELDEMEARIEALERTHEREKGARPWRGA